MAVPTYLIMNGSVYENHGPTYSNAFNLGSLTVRIMLNSVGTYFSMSMITFVAQAAGAKNYKLCWLYLQRQYVLNFMLFLVLCLPLFFFELVYRRFGNDPESSWLAALYVWI